MRRLYFACGEMSRLDDAHAPAADDAGALLADGRPVLREGVVDHLVGFDAEGLLDDLEIFSTQWRRYCGFHAR